MRKIYTNTVESKLTVNGIFRSSLVHAASLEWGTSTLWPVSAITTSAINLPEEL